MAYAPWMMVSFCASFTMAIFQAGSFVTMAIFVSPGLSFPVMEKDDAEQTVAREIQKFAVTNGAPNRYHDTLTRFWVRLVGHVMEKETEVGSIDDLFARFPFLLEKSLPYRHWRGETFNSDRARAGWVEPDLIPMP